MQLDQLFDHKVPHASMESFLEDTVAGSSVRRVVDNSLAKVSLGMLIVFVHTL